MEIWRSEWETILQMQTLKTRVWRAIYRNKNRFCGVYVSRENKRECVLQLVRQTVSARTRILPMNVK